MCVTPHNVRELIGLVGEEVTGLIVMLRASSSILHPTKRLPRQSLPLPPIPAAHIHTQVTVVTTNLFSPD